MDITKFFDSVNDFTIICKTEWERDKAINLLLRIGFITSHPVESFETHPNIQVKKCNRFSTHQETPTEVTVQASLFNKTAADVKHPFIKTLEESISRLKKGYDDSKDSEESAVSEDEKLLYNTQASNFYNRLQDAKKYLEEANQYL